MYLCGTMTDPEFDRCLRLISDRRRRQIIQRLRPETGGETPVEDLVDFLHAQESNPATTGGSDRDQLLIQVTHSHLPKLDEHGIVHFDRELGTVRYQSDELVEAVLDALPREVPIGQY